MANENVRVRFIRIRGRVVPITAKQRAKAGLKYAGKMTGVGAVAGATLGAIDAIEHISKIKNLVRSGFQANKIPINVGLEAMKTAKLSAAAHVGKTMLQGAGIVGGIGLGIGALYTAFGPKRMLVFKASKGKKRG